MRHPLKFLVVAIGAVLGMASHAQDQCIVCSDFHQNSSVGLGALVSGGGSNNTALGAYALTVNGGNSNTAVGYESLYQNTDGAANIAVGFRSLYSNTSGNYNTGYGYNTLFSNSTGTYNNAIGVNTLQANTIGGYNNAMGVSALYSNTTGSENSAVGYGALYSNIGGSYNAALGYFAGFNLTSGSNNVDISNRGVAAESGIIRIGTAPTQTAAYIAGISTSQITGSAVYVTSSGQLGVLASSERYKTAVAPMGASTDKLHELRPVSFHLKNDANGPVQYGLIAEEVDKVYPELVIRDDTGRIQGVRYDELAPMLLNELQAQQSTIRNLTQQNAEQAAAMADLEKRRDNQLAAQAEQLRMLRREFTALERKMQSQGALVTAR